MKFSFIITLLLAFQIIYSAPFPAENSQWGEAELQAQRAAGLKLQQDIEQAIKEKKSSFEVQKGVYRFTEVKGKRPYFLNFVNAQNFTLNGNGSHFYFEKQAAAIQIYKSTNVVIKDLFLDYDPLPFTQGTVVSIDHKKNTFIFRPEKGYEAYCPQLTYSLRGILFDKDRLMKKGQNGFGLALKDKQENGDYQVLVRGFHNRPAKECGFEEGDLITMFGRTDRAVKIEVSADCRLENITLYSSPFVAFVENVGKGNHVYKNCYLIKRPGTTRLMSGNADGFNSANVLIGPKLDGCKIDTIGDDFVNFHGTYYRVFEQVSPTELIVQGFSSNSEKNPTLSFLENPSWKHLGTRKITADTAMTYVIPDAAAESLKTRWAAGSNFKPGQKVQARRITLDQPIEFQNAPIFSCLSAIAANSEIRNCDFKGSLARGIRFQSRDAVIENNTLTMVMGPHLTFGGQPGFWGESITCANVIVRNNRFIDAERNSESRNTAVIEITAPGGRDGELVKNITLENNEIIDSGAAAIHVKNAENIKLLNNRINGINRMYSPNRPVAENAIVVSDASTVEQSGNTVSK